VNFSTTVGELTKTWSTPDRVMAEETGSPFASYSAQVTAEARRVSLRSSHKECPSLLLLLSLFQPHRLRLSKHERWSRSMAIEAAVGLDRSCWRMDTSIRGWYTPEYYWKVSPVSKR